MSFSVTEEQQQQQESRILGVGYVHIYYTFVLDICTLPTIGEYVSVEYIGIEYIPSTIGGYLTV